VSEWVSEPLQRCANGTLKSVFSFPNFFFGEFYSNKVVTVGPEMGPEFHFFFRYYLINKSSMRKAMNVA
jgi:hypothetical protein